jgi:transposase
LELASCGRERGSGSSACGRSAKRWHSCSKREEAIPREDQEALGVSRGGFSTKIHLPTEGKGKPIAVLVTAGERHEESAFQALMESAAIKRAGRGRPRIRPDRVVGDKGYSSGKKIRTYLRKRDIGAVIARQKSERQVAHFSKEAYRERNVVERTINRLKQFRRVATRYEKRAANYRAMLTIAAIVIWV